MGVWSHKETVFDEESKQFCVSRNVEPYNTHSETKYAFAEQNIRLLKNINYKDLEKKGSYH